MGMQGIVVQPGQGPVSSFTPGRSIVLKLLCGATDDSIMVFEETIPSGTKSMFHLHHDSDEAAYVLSGEVTFMIGDEVTVGGPRRLRLHATRRAARLEEHRRGNRARAVSLYSGQGRRVDRRAAADRPQIRIDE